MNATDFDPGDTNLEEDDVDETEALYDDLARHYAQHGLKDPEGYFDSADEEVQEILSSGYVTEKVHNPLEDRCVRDTNRSLRSNTTNFIMRKACAHSHSSKSIKRISNLGDLEDDVFLGYFAVNEGKVEKPIPAPRRQIG